MEPEWDELEEFRLRKIIELAPFSSWQQKTELFNMIASVDHRPIRSQSGVKQKHQRAVRNQQPNASLPSRSLHETAYFSINLDITCLNAACSGCYNIFLLAT